jgi:hypothetical protein
VLPFGVTIPATVPHRSEIPEGLMNYPVYASAQGKGKAIILFQLSVSIKVTTLVNGTTNENIQGDSNEDVLSCKKSSWIEFWTTNKSFSPYTPNVTHLVYF